MCVTSLGSGREQCLVVDHNLKEDTHRIVGVNSTMLYLSYNNAVCVIYKIHGVQPQGQGSTVSILTNTMQTQSVKNVFTWQGQGQLLMIIVLGRWENRP